MEEETEKSNEELTEQDEKQEKEAPKYRFEGKYYYGMGRRKNAKAQVRLYDKTKNKKDSSFFINDKSIEEHTNEDEKALAVVSAPLKTAGLEDKFTVSARTSGGGKNSQIQAIQHGISRALVVFNEELRKTLKKSGFLTRDPRMKERKKYGLKRARKAPQYTKR